MDEGTSAAPLIIHVLYPMLVTIKLLKLNFFEFSRSCLDGSELGLPSEASQPGGVLCSIREILFSIADHVSKLPLSGEALWFYHAVKQETASAICYGFSTLFPSLLDKLQIMNRLMVSKCHSETELTPGQKLLIPMLVPGFTSTKMLFQLMTDPDTLFEADGSSDAVVTETVITFMSTLLDGLWEQMNDVIKSSSGDITGLMKRLDAIEMRHEFNERWLHSPLFRGGLEELWSGLEHENNEVGRNEALLLQVVDNVGNGKKLLDKVRNAVDPGSAPGSANPQLRVARLKRQDSVEATLEKSGGIEAVDRAVRATYAALLKHTNISYTTEPISSEGALAETVVDAWKAALQLRRWIVREQQKLAAAFSEAGAPNGFSPDMEAKERQKALYNAVCEPIIRRALLLLQLAPAPIQTSPSASSPMKILPGISMATSYDFLKATQREPADTATLEEPERKRFTRQLNKLMETKSMEVMEEEDEQIHADIFSFIQQSSSNLLTSTRGDEGSTRHPEDLMRDILLVHQKRAKQRLQGLKTFARLLHCTENIPSSRFHVIPMFSSAFKRVRLNSGKPSANLSTGQTSIVKIHYLVDLEFAGPQLSDAIGREFFQLLAFLLKSSSSHLCRVQQLIEAGLDLGSNEMRSSSTTIQSAVQDMLLVLEMCCLPYRGQDWDHLQRTNLVSLLTEFTSWKGWQSFIQYDGSDDSPTDADSTETYAILPAASGSKYPNIICSRYVTLGTDLRKLTITHKSIEGSDDNTLIRMLQKIAISVDCSFTVKVALATCLDLQEFGGIERMFLVFY
ncbi:hypothetical protein PF004_g10283 [Phytophthora fragariae]|uniref:Uncharacterized protein n=1 Tax=Phytophthora fragariae TaxID=53985 RepID=A0A6G0P1A6_9STRA|nr:hypothetical protein PF004_g10283 [Phytophthora fragariae]